MKILRNCILSLVGLLLAVACQQEDDNQTIPQGSSSVTIMMAAPVPTQPKDAVSEVELIQNYRVIIATATGSVVRCIDGVCDPAVELDPIETTLGLGTYHVYGFANIDTDYLNGLGLCEGGQVPSNIASIRFFMPVPFSGTTLLPVENMTDGIPMTSARQTITVTGRNQTFGIEVRRLFAKLEFRFSNPTSDDMVLASQSISNMTINQDENEGSVLLVNYNDADALNLPTDCPIASLTHTYTTPLELNAGATNISRAFYVLESQADPISNSFIMDFDVRTASEPDDEELRFALTDPETLTAIHRNDWIVIPITLGEWQMRLEARTYPPIGGYPEADIEDSGSNEFVVKFDGGGEFSIRPFIRKVSEGDNWFGIDNTAKISGTPTITVDDTDGIFLTEPTITQTGEIRGKMKVASGKKAGITLTVKVVTSAFGVTPITTKILTRKIFVTQK